LTIIFMSLSESRISIPFDRPRIKRILFQSLLFMCAGLCFLLIAPSLLSFSGYVCVCSSLILAFDSVKKLVTSKPGFLIDDSGISGYSGSFYFGSVLWAEITDVRIVKILWQKTIVIYVNDPLTRIKKQKNPLLKFPMRVNYFFIGSPLCITTEALGFKVGDLFEEIERKRKSILAAKEGNDGVDLFLQTALR
jgi:hypothetical protein